jgi:hypothetical protein
VTSFTTANLLRRRATYGAGFGSERYSITEIDQTGTKAALPMQIPTVFRAIYFSEALYV